MNVKEVWTIFNSEERQDYLLVLLYLFHKGVSYNKAMVDDFRKVENIPCKSLQDVGNSLKILQRLHELHLIEEVKNEDEGVIGRSRKYYQIDPSIFEKSFKEDISEMQGIKKTSLKSNMTLSTYLYKSFQAAYYVSKQNFYKIFQSVVDRNIDSFENLLQYIVEIIRKIDLYKQHNKPLSDPLFVMDDIPSELLNTDFSKAIKQIERVFEEYSHFSAKNK
jgi:hypothetical protein